MNFLRLGHRLFGAFPILCIAGLGNIYPSGHFLSQSVKVLPQFSRLRIKLDQTFEIELENSIKLDLGERNFNHVNEFVSRYESYERYDSCQKSHTYSACLSPEVINIQKEKSLLRISLRNLVVAALKFSSCKVFHEIFLQILKLFIIISIWLRF